MPRPLRHIAGFLSSNELLAACIDHAQRSAKLLDRVRAGLPDELSSHCREAMLDGDSLTLVVESSVWSARLRMALPELLEHLRQADIEVERCRVRVAPSPTPQRASSKAPQRRLSRASADHLLAAAESIEDTKLAELFRRIAANSEI